MKHILVNKSQTNKVIAIILIVISFLLYTIMPFNVYLPFSVCIIAGITGAMIVASEVMFWMGRLMIGREVAKRIRNKVSIRNIIVYIKGRKKEKE